MKRVRARIHELTPKGRCHADLRDVIKSLNPVLQGWSGYFQTGNASQKFGAVDQYVERRLRGLLHQRKARHLKPGESRKWTRDFFENLGLIRLKGRVPIPGSCVMRLFETPPVSRMREIPHVRFERGSCFPMWLYPPAVRKHDLPMHMAYAAPTLVFGAISALGFFLAQRKAKKVKFFQQEELEVSQVKGAGVCKVHGVVVASQPLISPISEKPVVWYRMLVQEYVRAGKYSRWSTIHDEAVGTRFQLKDRKGPGSIEVDPSGAEVLLSAESGSEDHGVLVRYLESKGIRRMLGHGELRCNETTLQPGEKIFVLGTVTEAPGRYSIAKGASPFVLSDTDSGQVAYAENSKMYVTRFWSGAAGLMTLWWLWHWVR